LSARFPSSGSENRSVNCTGAHSPAGERSIRAR
jgi:hypothetical protein